MYVIPTTCSAAPITPLPRRTFLVSELTALTARLAQLAQAHPTWPSSRVRSTVARELNISTVTLRYMLSKATEL